MILENFTVSQEGAMTRFGCSVTDGNGSRPLWFLREGLPFTEADGQAVNWAAAAMIIPAMLAGEDLEIRGTLSEKLFHFLRDAFQHCMHISNPKLALVTLTCSDLTTQSVRTGRIASGFSAGIDSLATFALHAPDAKEATLRLTDLATFDVGAMGPPGDPDVDALFERYKTRTTDFGARHGLGAFSVASNIDLFYGGLTFEDTYVFRNVAAALTAEAHLDYYLVSSGKSLTKVGVYESDSVGHVEPVILPMLSPEGLEFVIAGVSVERFDKTRLIAGLEEARDVLDVCQSPAADRLHLTRANCSRCVKCMRTLTALDLLDVLDDFAPVLDVDFYRRHTAYVQYQVYKHARRGSTLDAETVDVAAKMGRPLRRAPYIPALFYLKRAREKLMERLGTS